MSTDDKPSTDDVVMTSCDSHSSDTDDAITTSRDEYEFFVEASRYDEDVTSSEQHSSAETSSEDATMTSCDRRTSVTESWFDAMMTSKERSKKKPSEFYPHFAEFDSKCPAEEDDVNDAVKDKKTAIQPVPTPTPDVHHQCFDPFEDIQPKGEIQKQEEGPSDVEPLIRFDSSDDEEFKKPLVSTNDDEDAPRRRPSLEDQVLAAFAIPAGFFPLRSLSLGSRPRPTEAPQLCARGVLGNADSGPSLHRTVSPSASYRAYSQRVFRNSRKLNLFDQDGGSTDLESRRPTWTGSRPGNDGRPVSSECSTATSGASVDRSDHAISSPEIREGRWAVDGLSETNDSGLNLSVDLESPSSTASSSSASYRTAEGFDDSVSGLEIQSKSPISCCKTEVEQGSDASFEMGVPDFSDYSHGIETQREVESETGTVQGFADCPPKSEDVDELDSAAAGREETSYIPSEAKLGKDQQPSDDRSIRQEDQLMKQPGTPLTAAEGFDALAPKSTATFVSKVTVLIQRPPEQRKGNTQQNGCRIRQIASAQLRTIRE